MIHVIDRTLSCLDDADLNAGDVLGFLGFLIQTEVDGIELSEKVFNLIAPLPSYPLYILRVENAADSEKYRGITRFVCRNAESRKGVYAEIYLSDVREAHTVARYAERERVRVQGLEDCLLGDYTQTFERLKNAFCGEIEFCPSDRCFCAAALAVEWALGFGGNIVTSFCGVGGFAPTEEIIIALRLLRLRKVGKTYEFFPEMSALLAKITGEGIPPNKPVIGEEIWSVESGVHVDGILKSPKCYEPFPPETTGGTRKIVLGKQSGSASVVSKLNELNINCEQRYIPIILERVKSLAAKKNSCVSEIEFAEIVNTLSERGRKFETT